MGRRRGRRHAYEGDIDGTIERWDERDVVFARRDLFRYYAEGSPEREEYYRAHPDAREPDERIAAMPRVGTNGGDFTALCDGMFEAAAAVAAEASVDGDPAPVKVTLPPDEAARRVKACARLLGADLVGTGPLRQEWVYSHVGRSFGDADGFAKRGEPVDLSHHTEAVAMGFRMDPDLTRAAPEFPTIMATGIAYALGAWASVRLARFIRGLGYSARAHHVYNYRVLAVPVAVDCGLGELSRAGFLMTREFGLGLRLGVVTTELPLEHDGPVDIGVQSFCERCEICAEYCPSGAIPKGAKTVHNGVRKWKLDADRCYQHWHVVGTDCAICMSTCPWTKPPSWLHGALTCLATIPGPHRRPMVAAERLFYGTPTRPRHRRTVGLESLRPTSLRLHMLVLAWAVPGLVILGVLWGALALRLAAPIAWIGYLAWLSWTVLGFAVAWTFAAERAARAAGVGAGLFGAVSAVGLALLIRLGALP